MATIAAGQTGEGTLEVSWQRRVGPAGPAHASYTPAWPVGRENAIRFDVVDRCTQERAPGGNLNGYAFVAGDNLRVVGEQPAAADEDGYGWITVVCERAGEAVLEVVDERNPADRLDLVAEERGGHHGFAPTCVDL
jgi:hypothetical protein